MAKKPVRPWHWRPKPGSPQDPRTWDNYYKVNQRSFVTGMEIALYTEDYRERIGEPTGMVILVHRLAPGPANRRSRLIYGNITPSSMRRIKELATNYDFYLKPPTRKAPRLRVERRPEDRLRILAECQRIREAQAAYREELRKRGI